MAVVDQEKKEVNAKIVFYGPALSGKTTNIHFIYSKLKPEHRGELKTLSTKTHRTLFFDFLPVEVGEVKGYNTRFFLYTVPGQIFYNQIRKEILKDVDGIVFVADSQLKVKEENIQSFKNLEENLAEQGRTLAEIPHLIQYNKRDLPEVQSLEDLHRQINKYNAPFFEAVANKGKGVLETLTTISKMVLKKLREQPQLAQKVETGPPQAYGLSDEFIVMSREEAEKIKAGLAKPPSPIPQPSPEPKAATTMPPAKPVQAPAGPQTLMSAKTPPAPQAQSPKPAPIPQAPKPAPTPPAQTPIPATPTKPAPTPQVTAKPAPAPAGGQAPLPANPEPAELALIKWDRPQLVGKNTLRLPLIFEDKKTGKIYATTLTIVLENLLPK
jgi:signal recognition particle receptor subunit beta